MHSGLSVTGNSKTDEQCHMLSEQNQQQEQNFNQNNGHQLYALDRIENSTLDGEQSVENTMSSQSTRVQTDADGLILPKKLINPCLESTDRKELHRELKFNNKIGKSVLNQKSELQRAYDKQKERQQQHLQEQHSPTVGDIKGELNRAILERVHKQDNSQQQDGCTEDDDDKQYVNPEYLNIRAKLRNGTRSELK